MNAAGGQQGSNVGNHMMQRPRADADRSPPSVMDDQMGHSDGSVQARYAHATTDMRGRLLDGLTAAWENAVQARRQLSPGSPVAILDRMLRAKIVSPNSPTVTPSMEKGRFPLNGTGPDLLLFGRADRI